MKSFEHLGELRKTAMQKKVGEEVVRKIVGRPCKPNMEYVHFRLDKHLHARLRAHAAKTYTNKSSIVGRAVNEFLAKHSNF